jgi:hypothetical protein
MHKRFVLSILSVAAILAASCAPSVSRSGDYGKISVAVGGASGRGLDTGWPGGTVPTFSSVTVTVSGSDMSTVTTSTSDSSGNLTVQVPAGSDRLVEVTTVPASGGGAPYFALGYSGSTTVNIGAGETVSVPIKLSLSKTKLVLPFSGETETYGFYIADSIKSPASSSNIPLFSLPEGFDACYDEYGRLYFFDAGYLYRYQSNSETGEKLSLASSGDYGNTYSSSDHRLYYISESRSLQMYYVDISQSEPMGVAVNLPPDVEYFEPVITADDEGYLYTIAYEGEYENPRIVKLSVNGETATTVAFQSLSNIGFESEAASYMTVNDLQVNQGTLYIAAADVYAEPYPDQSFSHGKVVAVSTSSLSVIWEAGWSGDSNNFPTSPATQFYGPMRFIGIAPKKLYILDQGFSWNGIHYGNNYAAVNRVVELDLETGAISDTGIENEVPFIDSYEYIAVC